jgi:hypothetical protein
MKASWKKALLVPTASLLATAAIFLPSHANYFASLAGQVRASDPAQQSVNTQAGTSAQNVKPMLACVDGYLKRLLDNGCPADSQAILIQTLDGRVLVDHNAIMPIRRLIPLR